MTTSLSRCAALRWADMEDASDCEIECSHSVSQSKDELGEWHPAQWVSDAYGADMVTQYNMNGMPWVWTSDFYGSNLHYVEDHLQSSAAQAPLDKREAKGCEEVISEEVWAHRRAVREKSVSIAKASVEYQTYAKLKAQDARDNQEPMTPNASDRAVSKRAWKYQVLQWRKELVRRYQMAGDNESTISTTDVVSCQGDSSACWDRDLAHTAASLTEDSDLE
mmetsp:Transcript_19467/g.35299  ORF Transcript_19467/g.35299 Transcript_19467/m.35299 type:complete len:221 (-) Transcript_19467:11-673(-)